VCSSDLGALVTGASPARLAWLRQYASLIGVAFQIQDDLLNLQADQARYGKEIGGDLWEGKRTLVLIHTLRSIAPDRRAEARRILDKPRADKTSEDIAALYGLIESSHSIGYARQIAQQLARKAERILGRTHDWMPPSIHRDFILEMAEHVITRDR
jgi:geranylgeranyl diphosphate synthase type II